MKLQQLSIFLENRAGRLPSIIGILGDAQIDIMAISLADTSDFGILRLIVDDVDKALEVLKANGIVCKINNVTVVSVAGVPGGLAKVMQIVLAANVSIEYMYAIAQSKSQEPLMVFRFKERDIAREALRQAGITIIDEL